jgi:hypothetical protein
MRSCCNITCLNKTPIKKGAKSGQNVPSLDAEIGAVNLKYAKLYCSNTPKFAVALFDERDLLIF